MTVVTSAARCVIAQAGKRISAIEGLDIFPLILRIYLNRLKCCHSYREARNPVLGGRWHAANHSRFLPTNGALRNDNVSG